MDMTKLNYWELYCSMTIVFTADSLQQFLPEVGVQYISVKWMSEWMSELMFSDVLSW